MMDELLRQNDCVSSQSCWHLGSYVSFCLPLPKWMLWSRTCIQGLPECTFVSFDTDGVALLLFMAGLGLWLLHTHSLKSTID